MRFPAPGRLGLPPAALNIRLSAFGLTLVTGVAVTVANPAPAVAVFAALAACGGAASAVAPDWPWTTATLGLLSAAYVVASSPAGPAARLVGAVCLGAVLWVIHMLYALATAIPVRAGVEPAPAAEAAPRDPRPCLAGARGDCPARRARARVAVAPGAWSPGRSRCRCRPAVAPATPPLNPARR